MKKSEGITEGKKKDIMIATESNSIRFGNWLLEGYVVVSPYFVHYWRCKKDGKIYGTEALYQKFKSEFALSSKN